MADLLTSPAFWGSVENCRSSIQTGNGKATLPLVSHTLPNVWIGVSTEDQRSADERIPHLLRVPVGKRGVRFLSVEPQIEDMEVTAAFGMYIDEHGNWRQGHGVSWVIQGGESGPKARPFMQDWAYSLRDQCAAAGVAYFLKQYGANPQDTRRDGAGTYRIPFHDSHGGNPAEWPEDLRNCRAFPGVLR